MPIWHVFDAARVPARGYLAGMGPQLPIGFSDFARIRREGMAYADKTLLAADVIRSGRQAVLLPRPRRFGKTLNLTMLQAFFEPTKDAEALFEGLEVTLAGPEVMGHFQRHAVIALTFKDVKHGSWAECLERIATAVAREVVRLRPTWSKADLAPEERETLQEIAGRTASVADLERALSLLSLALDRATSEPVVLLIDEYDTPIHAGFVHGYYDDVVSFFRSFLSAGFKDNPNLYRGVLTGILRVAKESIFSGLNNIAVHTVLSDAFSAHFGLLEHEVEALAHATGQPEMLPDLRAWYNGYGVGSRRIYNPWSVLCALQNPADGFRPYWINTASDDILRDLLVRAGLGVHDDLSALIRGEAIDRPVAEEIVLRDVRHDPDALWSFLLFSGYLTADAPLSRASDGSPDSPLRIPNREVATVYQSIFEGWLRRSLSKGSDAPQRLARALLIGDAETFRALLGRLMMDALSYHDTAGRSSEAVYQAFIVGLLVQLEATHDVRSNRESGYGRYDVLIRPRIAGQPGAVLELKVVDSDYGETADVALQRAMTQVRERQYAAELLAAGASPAWQWAAVFDGKRAWVEVERA